MYLPSSVQDTNKYCTIQMLILKKNNMAWKEVTCLNISLCKHWAERETSEYQVDYYIAVSCEAHGAWWSDSTAA